MGRSCLCFGAIVFGVLGLLAQALAQSPPANDNFANALLLNGTNVSVVGSNINATKEPGEPAHAGVPGGKSVWWKWRAPKRGYVTVSTAHSTSQFSGPLDTVLGIYIGDSVSTVVEVASNDDGPVDVTSELNFRAAADALYYIAVDGYAGSPTEEADSGRIVLSLKLADSPPSAPAWGPLPCLAGGTLSATNFIGKVVVLNFWATWCGPCVAEIPDLVALHNKYASAGLSVVGLSLDSSPDGINPPRSLLSAFTSQHGMSYPIAMCQPQDYGVEQAYGGVPYIPNTFIIDRQNQLRQSFVGSQSYSTFEAAVLPLLYLPPSPNIRISAGLVHLGWELPPFPVSVETTADPASGLWTPVAAPIQSEGAGQFIEVPVSAGAQFFRLTAR